MAAKRGRPAEAKALEGELIKKWDGKDLKAKASRGLELASIRAVARVTELIDSDNHQVALAASREVLARNFGMPKASVDVSVTDTSAAHHAALMAIYERAKAKLAQNDKPLIDQSAETIEPIQEQTINALAYEQEQDGNE